LKIFIAIAQYQKMLESEEMRIARRIGLKKWTPTGFHPAFYESIQWVRQANPQHEFLVAVVRGDDLSRARCTLFGWWLKEREKGNQYDYFWTIDTDMSFEPSCLQRMIDSGKSIIGGSCAFKSEEKAGESVTKLLPGEKINANGLLKVLWLNGAFVFVESDALLRMMDYYPELWYQRVPEDGCDVTESYAFWTFRVHTLETGETILLSEDYSFSEYAREAGFDVWLDTTLKIGHWKGDKVYYPNLRSIEQFNSTDPVMDTPVETQAPEIRA
jgi:hypothetical protein